MNNFCLNHGKIQEAVSNIVITEKNKENKINQINHWQ